MVYSGIYLLPKSNSSTIKSEHSNSNHPNQANVTNNNHLKNTKKLSSTGSTSNRSSESSRLNETSSNVTIKSDINKCNPKLAPEIVFLIKEHAKTLETINQISKKLQEIELKVDDISQRLSKENSLNSNYNHKQVNNNQNDQTTSSTDSAQVQKTKNSSNQKELNQTRLLPYSYKDVDHLSNNHLSNNLSNNATNIIPNNQILSDDSGGEYGNKTTKTVSDDDELLSILEKITKCSHHILHTQQAYQQQGVAIYNSLSKPYAYSHQPQNLSSNQFNNYQFNQQQQSAALQNTTSNHCTNSHHNIQNSRNHYNHNNNADIYNLHQQQPPAPQNFYYSATNNPYFLNAKSPIKTATSTNQQSQTMVPTLKYNNQIYPMQPGQHTASLNELLFEPNVERFLSNLDQLVCNEDTNLAAILNTSNQTNHNQTQQQVVNLNSTNLPILQHSQNQQFIQVSPHHSTPIQSTQPIPILTNNNNLRTNYLTNSNLSPNLLNSTINSNYGNYGNLMQNVQSSISQQNYLNNISLHDASTNNIQHQSQQQQQQQFINWQKARELLEKKERERIDNQLKQADEWLCMVDHINRNKYQSPNKTITTSSTATTKSSNNTSNNSQGNK